MKMSRPVILTGLRANNDLHIGNYLGAILPMVDMAREHADEYEINFFVPDLHSFTTPIEHDTLSAQVFDNVRMYIAAGLPVDSKYVHAYRQSAISAHSELAWILSCFTSFGEMNRMTQFKDKSDRNEFVSVGLFSYPVLMAADILLYDASYVPVGDDQTQHLEFTRDIAERMNRRFGELFTVPHPVKKQHEFFGKDQGLRIRDLQDPSKKMSKSNESGKGVIFLNDSPDIVHKKIMSATTDSFSEVAYDYNERPGISNLLEMYSLLGGDTSDYIGATQYGPLKTAVADRSAAFVEDFQTRESIVSEQDILDVLQKGETACIDRANRKIESVQKALGLRP